MIYGIDEAGRGCLAGPVTAACVSFIHYNNRLYNNNCNKTQVKNKYLHMISKLADSKTLSADKRTSGAISIKELCIWGVGWAYAKEIDTLNIHNATLLAMERAFISAQKYAKKNYPQLSQKNITILVDGKFAPKFVFPSHFYNNLKLQVETKIKGDTYIPQIQAASIIAKTSRDAHMMLLDTLMPEYGFASHKGYPTARHKKAIKNFGICYFYRKSFKHS